MFTYNFSLNAVTILPLEKIVSTQLAKYFWNAPFKSEELKSMTEVSDKKWEFLLVNHREKTISTLNIFMEKNKLPSLFKTILKESIFSLYQAYRQMLLWKIIYDPDNKIDLLQEGKLYAPNYFIEGEFKDFIWAKQLVMNSNYEIHDRFNLACFYWFENETVTLWSDLKRASVPPFGGSLDAILPQMEPLTALRVIQIENQVEEHARNRQYAGDFWEVGFKYSAEKGYEHATYHFWQNIAESKRIYIKHSESFFELMSGAIDYPYDKVSYFLYSHLPTSQKENFLNWTIKQNKPEKWLTLLLSPYAKVVHSEILEFVYKLPIKLYPGLLQSLAHRIQQLKLPSDSEIFQVLWHNLSSADKNYSLKEGTFIIQGLIKGKSFDNVGYIIKGFSLEQKEKCLFNGWYGAGVNCLDILSKEGEFDFLQKYLSFFLIDIDPLTEKEILRKDASSFLRKFIETPDFRTWYEKEITEKEQKHINELIDILQTSLDLLDKLCDKVCAEVMSQALIQASFKADSEVYEEMELAFLSSAQKRKCEEAKPAKRLYK